MLNFNKFEYKIIILRKNHQVLEKGQNFLKIFPSVGVLLARCHGNLPAYLARPHTGIGRSHLVRGRSHKMSGKVLIGGCTGKNVEKFCFSPKFFVFLRNFVFLQNTLFLFLLHSVCLFFLHSVCLFLLHSVCLFLLHWEDLLL